MKNLWKWYETENPLDNIDSFLTDLKKANKQNGVLLSEQIPHPGDIQTSCQMLLLASHQPIEKVLDVALEMDRFLKKHYSTPSDEVKMESIAIPAMLESLQPKFEKLQTNSATKAKILITKKKMDLSQPEVSSFVRDTYDKYAAAYKATLEATPKPTAKQNLKAGKIIEI